VTDQIKKKKLVGFIAFSSLVPSFLATPSPSRNSFLGFKEREIPAMRLFMIPLSRTASMMHCHSTHTPSSASYLNRSTAWAGNKWEGLSAAKPETMKYKLHGAGSRMLEKLEHQEIFLKEVPPKEDITITTMVRAIVIIIIILFCHRSRSYG
jgi:hypothetical protein